MSGRESGADTDADLRAGGGADADFDAEFDAEFDGEIAARADRVRALLRELGPVLVAFSGGVDSSLVLALALEVWGPESVLAVTAHGDVHTVGELEAARAAAARLGAPHRVLETEELSIPGFAANSPDRCYLCKRTMYGALAGIAGVEGLKTVVDGTNHDDREDYRPGARAAAELGVRSPLAEAEIDKEMVRRLARALNVPHWDRPATPCLASRFPYGEPITAAALESVAEGERHLRELGFTSVRLRHHGRMARIEVVESEIARAADPAIRRAIVRHLKDAGYVHISLDLQGFRSGSLNEGAAGIMPSVTDDKEGA